MHFSRAAVIALLLLASACGGSRSVSATGTSGGTGRYTAQVQGYLDLLAANAREQGYRRRAAGPVFGSLNLGQRQSHEMTIVGGTSYVLVGACDNDCTDVDLKVHDARGNLVMEDDATDDRPVVIFTPRVSGRYRVDVLMAACSENPCRYGVQLMAK